MGDDDGVVMGGTEDWTITNRGSDCQYLNVVLEA